MSAAQVFTETFCTDNAPVGFFKDPKTGREEPCHLVVYGTVDGEIYEGGLVDRESKETGLSYKLNSYFARLLTLIGHDAAFRLFDVIPKSATFDDVSANAKTAEKTVFDKHKESNLSDYGVRIHRIQFDRICINGFTGTLSYEWTPTDSATAGSWICEYCETQNSDSICTGCGAPRG